MGKANKTALTTIISIIIFNVGTRFLGFYRVAVRGRELGGGLEDDVYVTALSLTTLIFLSIGSGISTTMIPIIVKEKNDKYRREIINNIFNFILIICALIMFVYLVGTQFIVSIFAGGFTGEKFELTVQLTRILTPTIVFINIAYLFVGILQSNEHFLLPTLISVPFNLLIIFYLFFGLNEFGVVGLAVITVVGWFLQMAIQLPRVLRLKEINYKFKIDFKNPELQTFIKGLFPIAFVMATSQLTYVTDNSFVSYYGDGKASTLYNANVLFVAISTIIVYGITAVMFPKFNKSYAENKNEFYKSITSVLEGAILLLIPVGIGIVVVSNELISLIFLTDEFNMDSVNLTANFLKTYSIYMVAFGIMDIMNKAYYTKNNRKMPVITALIIVTTNLILNFLLTRVFSVGIYGVVIGTAVAFYVGIVASLAMFKSDEGNIDFKNVFVTLTKSLISVSLMYVAITLIQNGMYSVMNVDDLKARMIFLVVTALTGVVVYFSSLLILKEKIMTNFVKSLFVK